MWQCSDAGVVQKYLHFCQVFASELGVTIKHRDLLCLGQPVVWEVSAVGRVRQLWTTMRRSPRPRTQAQPEAHGMLWHTEGILWQKMTSGGWRCVIWVTDLFPVSGGVGNTKAKKKLALLVAMVARHTCNGMWSLVLPQGTSVSECRVAHES